MSLQILDPTQYPGWDSMLLGTPSYSFFHSSEWARVLSESYGFKSNYFVNIREGKLSVLIPFMEVNSFLTGRRGVSLPFTDYCEPIISNGFSFQNLFDQIAEHGKKRGWRSMEFRSLADIFPGTQPSLNYLGYHLDLSEGEGKVFSNFRDSTLRNAKKALKEGVEVERDQSLESIKEFYRLNCLTRKEHGLPPQPFYFFRKIYDHVISKDLGMVVLASHNKAKIAGAIYFHIGKNAVFKYGASDKKFQHLRANNLVMLEAIRWYCKNGYRSLCFGRTELEHQGLIQFKSGWGASEKPIHYYRYDLRMGSFVRGSSMVSGFHNKIFRNTPIPLLKGIGSVLYKHTG